MLKAPPLTFIGDRSGEAEGLAAILAGLARRWTRLWSDFGAPTRQLNAGRSRLERPRLDSMEKEPSQNPDDAVKRLLLLQAIAGLGSVVELDFDVDPIKFDQDLAPFHDKWVQYNPRKAIARQGLSVTSLDGGLGGVPDLDSVMEYNRLHGTRYAEDSFTTPTPVFHHMSSLRGLLDKFGPDLGRSHLIRFGKGGFFPPHRDAFGFGMTCFRIISLCRNCGRNQFVFLMNGERACLEAGKTYFVETRVDHSVFSFDDDCVILVLNVKLNERAFRSLMDSVRVR